MTCGLRNRCSTAELRWPYNIIPDTENGDQRFLPNSQSYADRRNDHRFSGIGLRSLVDGFLLNAKVENKSPATIRHYGDKLGNFLRYAEEYRLPVNAEDLTAQHIREFLVWLKETKHRWHSANPPANKPVAPATVCRYYACLRNMFNWAIREGLVADNPVLRIKPPKEPRAVIKALSTEQIISLLATPSNSFEGLRDRALLMVMLDTGLRLGEATAIKLEDIDLQHQVITVWGKGAKQRRVRFGVKSAKALWRYMATRAKLDGSTDSLWVNRNGNPITQNGIELIFKRLSRKTGVKFHPHQLRHTYAICALRNGMNPFTLQASLGHSSLEMTKRYIQSLGFEDVYREHEKASPVDRLRAK